MSYHLTDAEIQDAQARFFDLALDIQCVITVDGVIVLCNAAFAKMFSTTPGALIGHTLQAYLDHATDDIDLLFADLSTVSRPTSFECPIQHFDDAIHDYLMTVYPPNTDGLCHLIGKDITPYREMEHRESERNIFAEALLDTVLAINTSLALEKVLERILSNIGKVVAYDDVTIILVNNQHAEVVGNLRRDPYHLDVTLNNERRFKINDYPSLQTMVETQDCLILPHVSIPPTWITTHRNHDEGSVLGAPIIVDNHVIGFLGIFNTQREFFTPLHAQQTITFANQAGIALQNARLYEQAQSAAILRERQRVAQELHDSVNQDLFAASTYADLLPKALEKKPELVSKYALDVSRLVRSAVEQMRMILIELQPDTLTNTGLDLLIKRLSETYAKRMEIDVDFAASDSFILSEQHQLAFYRIAQEALHNIEKHANATCVTVDISKVNDVVQLTIEDNGVGFHLDDIPDMHFGVRGMRDRADSIGAVITVTTEIDCGTKIILRKDYS